MSGQVITEVKVLESGYVHIRGLGPCNWAQPPFWPCDEQTLRAHTFGEACESFILAALDSRPWGRFDEDRAASEDRS